MAQSAFDRLAGKLAQKKGINNPRAVAAAIGRRKYGSREMARRSAASRRKHRRRRRHA